MKNENEKWKMKNEKWKMKNEKWKMKNEKWKSWANDKIVVNRNTITRNTILHYTAFNYTKAAISYMNKTFSLLYSKWHGRRISLPSRYNMGIYDNNMETQT